MKNIKRGSKLPSTPESQFEGHLSFSSSPGLFVFSTELRFLPGFKGITRLERGCDSTTWYQNLPKKQHFFFTRTQNRYIIFTFYLTITRQHYDYHHHNHHHHHHHLLSDLKLLDLLITIILFTPSERYYCFRMIVHTFDRDTNRDLLVNIANIIIVEWND